MLKGLVLCFVFLIVQLGILHLIDRRVAASDRQVHYSSITKPQGAAPKDDEDRNDVAPAP